MDPVGVWDSVDRDYSLGHGHSADLGVVVAEAGKNGGQDMPGLVRSHKPAQQGREVGVQLGKGGLGSNSNVLEASQQECLEYFAGCRAFLF